MLTKVMIDNHQQIMLSLTGLRNDKKGDLYRDGARLEGITKTFGHQDTKTTIRHLGLDCEDMSETMANYARYQNPPIVPKMVQLEESYKKSG
jgi:hypothetical protein